MQLRGIDLFAQIPGDQLVPIAEIAEEVEFAKGQTIFSAGDVGDVLYLILEGEVRVHLGAQTIAELGTGQCFGELSILDREPRSASCTATTDVRALALGEPEFAELLWASPELGLALLRILASRLRRASGRS